MDGKYTNHEEKMYASMAQHEEKGTVEKEQNVGEKKNYDCILSCFEVVHFDFHAL